MLVLVVLLLGILVDCCIAWVLLVLLFVPPFFLFCAVRRFYSAIVVWYFRLIGFGVFIVFFVGYVRPRERGR